MWPADTKYAIYTPSSPEDTEFEETINDIHLQNGIKYSVEVTAVNKAELGSKQDSMGVIVDTTPPVLSKVYFKKYLFNLITELPKRCLILKFVQLQLVRIVICLHRFCIKH